MRVSIADQKSVVPVFPVLNIFSGKQWLSSLSHFQTVVRSPGVPDALSELVSYKARGGFVTSSANIFFADKTDGNRGDGYERQKYYHKSYCSSFIAENSRRSGSWKYRETSS